MNKKINQSSMTYLQRISANKDEKAREERVLQNEATAASIDMQTAILTTSKEILSAEKAVEDAKSKIPFSAKVLLDALDSLDLSKRDMAQYVKLQKELFYGS